MGARYLRARCRPRYRRERIPTPDGDFLDLDHFRGLADGRDPPPSDPGTPVVLLLHGLEGSSRSGYVVHAARLLARRGVRAVALNFRGCSGTPNLTPRMYHSGATGDPRVALARLAARWPRAALGIAGFSLGGNVVLKLLGEWGDDAPPSLGAAAAVSVPFDLRAAAERMDRGAGRIYARLFLRSLQEKARGKARAFPECYDLEAALGARSLREFDDGVTAPVHGFRDAADYYRRASSAPRVPGVRRPTLVVQARNDPLVPHPSVPEAELRANPHVSLRLTAGGGHVGFVAGRPTAPRFCAERWTAAFLGERLGR